MTKSVAKVFVFLGLKLWELAVLVFQVTCCIIAASLLCLIVAGVILAVIHAMIFLGMFVYHSLSITTRDILQLPTYGATMKQYLGIGGGTLVLIGLSVGVPILGYMHRESVKDFFASNWEYACKIVEGETK